MSAKNSRIGFMQGRLSPLIDGKIQAFPWPYWEAEFALAASIGLGAMEWTLDQDRILENPLMTEAGRLAIRRLSAEHGVQIPSLTGDCFMQAPFWKASGPRRAELVGVFEQVLQACAQVGIRVVVVPLVDNGALSNASEQQTLIGVLGDFVPMLQRLQMVIAFESDFAPRQQAEFIARLPGERFGINFDMGNSASLGWDPVEEIGLLAPRIANVHVKDRVVGGTTVPLGQGAAQLPKVFSLLRDAGYQGNLILQTARAADGQHVQTIARYAEYVKQQMGIAHES
jgi:L-ribulose-5-phosphate 3-epimerase